MKVLLTDGSHKNTLAIMRYLGKLNFKIDILHHKKSAPAYSKFCNQLIICPNVNDEIAYFDFVLYLVKNNSYDILIPVGVKPVEIFSKRLELLKQFVKIEIPEYNILKVALDKKLTFQFAEENNIPHPKTIYPNNIEEAIILSEKLNFPVIIKSSNESVLKFPTIYIENKNQLIKELENLVEKEKEQVINSFPLVQERIFGSGFGFFAIYQNGKCKRIFMHKRLRENPVSGGISTCAKSFYDTKLLEIGKNILDKLNWHGQAMVEFKQDEKTGEFKLIEINPKFWGSLELCLSAGMNFPLSLCEMAQGQELEYIDNYNKNRKFLWIVASNGELYRLFQKPSDFFIVIGNWMSFNSRSDFWLSDPKPTFLQFAHFLIFVKNKIKNIFTKK